LGGTAVIEVRGDEAGGRQQGLRSGTVGAIEGAWRRVGAWGKAAFATALVITIGVTAWCASVVPEAVGAGGALAILVVAALVDVVEHRLPNPLVAAGAAAVAVTLVAEWSPDAGTAALAGAAIVGVPLLATHLVSPAGMGFGDVKAGAVVGAAVALVDAQLAALTLVLGLAGAAVWGLTRRVRSIPLGPALVGGALAALAVGRLLGLEVHR
jgi:leader peptidase (prepilin peptidase)/N-methyltransferase